LAASASPSYNRAFETGKGVSNVGYVAVAAEAALRAGAIQKARYGQAIEIKQKGEIDLVTEVDRACEDAILDILRARCPGHDIVTEETDLARTGSRYVWYTDPLDGTTNYAHGYPFFCTSVALTIDGQPRRAGAVYDPIKDELFHRRERAGGARWAVPAPPRVVVHHLLRSLLVTGFPYDLRDDLAAKLKLFNRFMGTRAPSAATARSAGPLLPGRGTRGRLLGGAAPAVGHDGGHAPGRGGRRQGHPLRRLAGGPEGRRGPGGEPRAARGHARGTESRSGTPAAVADPMGPASNRSWPDANTEVDE
jgi:fructose-1,6-bisphosphatase/inositol monophosphatase family enzyme